MRIIYRLMVGVSSLSARGAAGARLPARFAPPSVKAFSAVASSAFSTTIIKPQERPEVSIPIPTPEKDSRSGGGVISRRGDNDHNGCQSWKVQQQQQQHQQHHDDDELPPGTISVGPERSRMPSSMCMVDTTSQLESAAPELLPLWVRYGRQLPEELARDVNFGGTLARVKLCEELDHASLNEACQKAMSGLPEAAAIALESLLCLQLKLSYLSTKTPRALKEYTHSRDAGGISRRVEAALLAHLSTEESFPCRDKSARVLPMLADHLNLTLREEDPQTWSAVEAVFNRAHPWAVRTECLLAEGCDDRITVPYRAGKTTNKYHCSPVPTPEVVSRSSCTSSSSSRRAFDSADSTRRELLQHWALKPSAWRESKSASPREGEGEGEEEGKGEREDDDRSFANHMSDIRRRLLGVLGMDDNTAEVFLTPSGSDAEFLPTALACVRARRLGHKEGDGPAVTSIVVAAGEVGSGTAGAAGGQHFSELTPRGVPGYPEHNVKGMTAGDVVVTQIKTRSKSGAFLPCEKVVTSAVHKTMASSSTSVVVVHFVAGSKTGICSPSIDALTKLQHQYGERLLVVVDACQLRSEAENIRNYAALGFLTLVTGSKFYCGPPFCGAVLFPPAALAELEAGHEHLPPGFQDYFTRHELDPRYPTLRSRLAGWENRGLLLRWTSALNNMEAVKSIPKDRLDAFVSRWVSEVRDSVQDKWPYLSLLPEQRGVQPCRAVGGVNTVVPLVVRVPKLSEGPDGNPEMALGYDDLRLFHRLLSEDISRLLPQDLAVGDRASARLRVLFGQPVKLGGASFGVVRIALGADMLIDTFCSGHPPTAAAGSGGCNGDDAVIGLNGGLDRLLAQDRLAVNKCTLMARHWHTLKAAATGTPPIPPAAAARPKTEHFIEVLSTTIKSMGKDDLILLESLVTARQQELHLSRG